MGGRSPRGFWARARPRGIARHAPLAFAVLLIACGTAQDVLLGGLVGESNLGGQGGDGGAMMNVGGGASLPECSAASPGPDRLQILANVRGFGRNVTGGAQGCVVVVSSPADSGPGTLREALEADMPVWIRFSVNEILLESDINLASNKTIDGSGGDVIIRNYGLSIGPGVSNIIVHGIEMVGTADGTGTEGAEESDDAIVLWGGARDVWVDHCNVSNYRDGLIDIIEGSTNITVSYNHFFNHRRVMLIGNENGGPEDEQIRVTLHHNWYERTESYHPRLRRGWVHSYNNYLEQWESFGSGSSEGGQLVSEANVYEAGPDLEATTTQIANDAEPGRLSSMSDVAINGAILTEFEPDEVFDPGMYYEYEPEAAGSELVATIQSEAGTR